MTHNPKKNKVKDVLDTLRRKLSGLPVLLAVLFLLAASPVTHAAEGLPALTSTLTKDYVQVPGLEAYFLPAKSLDISDKFDGFASEERGVEVVVAVIGSPYATIAESFTENTLKSRGVNLLSKAAFVLNGAQATLMKAQHPEGNRSWGKWILLLDGGDRTLVANGVFASGDEAAALDVEAMLKSVVFTPKATSASNTPDAPQSAQLPQATSESVTGINPE